jgi:hypothetical protein
MRKIFVLAIILLVLSSLLTSNAKAGGTVNIYYVGPSDSQVRKALGRMRHLLTFVDDPTNAQVFVLNGIIPENKIIAQRVQSGVSGLVLFLSPEMKPGQIQMLLGTQDTINLIQKNNTVSLQAIKNTDPIVDVWFSEWMGTIDWKTAPQVKDRFVISVTGFTPLVQSEADNSLILGYMLNGKSKNAPVMFTFIFTPFLDNKNAELQNWKYFDYLVNILVATSDRGGLGSYDGFSTAFPAITPPSSAVSKNISTPVTLTNFLLFIILIVTIVLLWRKKNAL